MKDLTKLIVRKSTVVRLNTTDFNRNLLQKSFANRSITNTYSI